VLLTIVRRGPIRLSELAEVESLNPTMLSRVISDLGATGLVARVSDDRDRRAAWVQSTSAGARLAERMRRERTAALNEALEGLDEDDQRLIERALPALEGLAEQLQDRRP
jgi:DNA-binding MarR family transcriptional regulator